MTSLYTATVLLMIVSELSMPTSPDNDSRDRTSHILRHVGAWTVENAHTIRQPPPLRDRAMPSAIISAMIGCHTGPTRSQHGVSTATKEFTTSRASRLFNPLETRHCNAVLCPMKRWLLEDVATQPWHGILDAIAPARRSVALPDCGVSDSLIASAGSLEQRERG